MKTIREVLRDADPMRHEPAWTTEARQRTREIVVNHARPAEVGRRLWLSVAAMIALALVIAAAALWPPAGAELVAAIRFEVRLAEDHPAPGLRQAVIAGSERTIHLHPIAVIGNGDIRTAQVIEDGTAFDVTVLFTVEGAAKMRRATAAHIGRPLAILFDGEVVTAPIVRVQIDDVAVIDGNYSRAEAERIAQGIQAR